MQQRQVGFTLIEMTIVLVIIGLLLGGVIKGQELINNAKAKSLASDFKNTALLIQAYQDKFQALPGDDGAATSHVAASKNGDGDGSIGGNWNDPATATSEAIYFWQNVRQANLATGSADTGDSNFLPKNAIGGRMGVQSNSEIPPIKNGDVAIRGSQIICSSGISGALAKQVDRAVDDGNTSTGSMLAGPAVAVGESISADANLNNDQTYTVCMGV